VEDHTALARALEALVESPELRASMGEQVRALRDALPTWTSIAQATTEMYETLVPRAGHTKTADPLYVHGGP
jgi:glycosyltransferase involved in cell wall biosynthesis